MPDKNRIQRYIDHKLSDLDSEIDVIDTNVNAITTLMQGVDGKVDNIQTDVLSIDGKADIIVTGVEGITETVGEIATYHEVPTPDGTNNIYMRDVIGNKTDTVEGDSSISLIKQTLAALSEIQQFPDTLVDSHTITVADGTNETTIALFITLHTSPIEFQLDVSALIAAGEGGTVTLRLKHKIDGTNLRVIDLATFLVGTDEIHPSVSAMTRNGTNLVQLTVQVSSAVTADRTCPYLGMGYILPPI